MARNLFNGTCSMCGLFLPRCARIRVLSTGGFPEKRTRVRCEGCRRATRGEWRLADEHKEKSR